MFRSSGLALALTSELRLECRGGDVHADFTLREQETTGFVLENVDEDVQPPP
jgi:hypothetical protein